MTNNGSLIGGNSTSGLGGLGATLLGGGTLTNTGTVQGGTGTSGGNGVSATLGGAATIVNNGTISAGSGTTGAGGVGVNASLGSSVTNNSGATLSGGNGATSGGIGVSVIGLAATTAVVTNAGTISGGNGTSAAGGFGVQLGNYTSLINTGTITGGSSQTSSGGEAINMASTTGPATLNNSGTITGGNGAVAGGGVGVLVRGDAQPITNSGTITGGNGALGIASSTGVSLVLTNSGTVQGGSGAAAINGSATAGTSVTITDSGVIAAGNGGANAIQAGNVANTIALELDAGYAITGAVAGNSGVTNTLTLGGDTNASFDVSTVGPQYQNFNAFNKTGASTWSLTGTATQATPWTISAGTLQIGNGTLNGSILGDVTDNAALAFDNPGSVTYAGAISGTGTVSQVGSGITILTGANSYLGGTNLNAGELSVASDTALGDPAGALNFNGGVLQVTGTAMTSTARTINWSAASGGFDIVAASNVFTVAQTLSGGPLTKLGAGTLVLTASDSVASTTIGAGTLQIGAGGTVGSITGNVTDNGTLAFDRSDAQTFGGVISGTGAVAQIAASTLTLSGVNTYSGGTLISAGTVTGSATSFGTGAITDNAALVINQPADAAFANAINGSGSFTKTGAGRINYTGTGTLSGPTTVAQGLLSVNGSLANSAITVASGATLGGNGTVGATTIQSGGTIAPGNSIGTLHVNGAFVQASGSTYQVEVDPGSTNADLIAVNGTATLQSGAGLNVTQNPAGEYVVGTTYKVLTATGGVNGTYALSGQTTSASAFLGLKDSYDPNNVYLTVVETRDPATAASTPNQVATAAGVDSLPVTNPVTTAVLNSSSDAGARSAFDQLSGQALASAQGALLANGLYVRNLAFDRLRNVVCTPDTVGAQACDGKRLSIWEQGFGGWGGVAGNSNALGLNHSLAGVLIGVDVPVDDWRVGVFGGYDHSDFNVIGNSAVGASNDYHLGIYGGTLMGGFALRLGASYSFDDIDTDRSVVIGSFSNNLRALYNGGTVQAFGELGYGIDMGPVSLEPFANLAYVSLRTGAFSEQGGPAALSVAANTTEDTIATLGVRPSTAISLGGLDGTLHGMVGWRRTFGQVIPDAQVAFAGGSSFSVTGAPIARNAAAVEAGIDVAIMQDLTFGLTYGGQFSSRTTDQTGWGSVRFSF